MGFGAPRQADILSWIGPDITGIERLRSEAPRLIAVSGGEDDAIGVWRASPEGIALGSWARLRALSRVAEGQPLACVVRRPFWKLQVFVPQTHLETLREALSEAGAGGSERYEGASFAAPGVGTFRPLAGARPYRGEEGKLARVEEYRLESLVPYWLRDSVEAALLRSHPYEEPAFDWIRLGNRVEIPCLWARGDEWWCVCLDEAVGERAARLLPRVVHAERTSWEAEMRLARIGVGVDRHGPGGLLLSGLTQLWEDKRAPW